MTETLVTPRVLREYALVADGERGALIAPDGSIAWLCVPRWDSPAAFSALLGDELASRGYQVALHGEPRWNGVAILSRAGLDDVLAGLAAEAADCDPDDGWYPDTGELEDLLDEVEDLAGQEPDAARELAGHVAARVTEVLAAGNCLTDDLADALARAAELRGDALPH